MVHKDTVDALLHHVEVSYVLAHDVDHNIGVPTLFILVIPAGTRIQRNYGNADWPETAGKVTDAILRGTKKRLIHLFFKNR